MTRFKAPAALLGQVRWWLLSFPFALSLFASFLISHELALGFMFQLVAFLWAGIFVAQRPRPRQAVNVRLDPAGSLYVGDRHFAYAGEIVGLLVTQHKNKSLLSLELRDGERADLELDDEAHVAELRASLQAGVKLASERFSGHVPFAGLSSLAVIGVALFCTARIALALGGPHPVLASFLACLVLVGVPLGVAALRTWSILVGAEGVRLQRMLGRRRSQLLPFRTLDVQRGRVGHHVVLRDDDEKVLALELGNTREAQHFAATIRHRREHTAAKADESIESQLARGGRSPQEWLAALRREAGEGQQGYRIARVPVDQLWAVLENVDAEPSARIGAAVRLRVQLGLDGESRERLRVAARATALPEVKTAAELLAYDEEEAVAMGRLARVLT